MILPALRSWLLADAAIADVVGTRVFPLLADQASSYPLIILQQISLNPELYSLGETGLVMMRMQVTCWADEYLDAHDLAHKVRLCVSGYTGDLGVSEGTLPGVQSIELDNVTDTDDQTPGIDSRRKYGVISDYLIWHAQSVPDHSTDEGD